MQYTQKITPNPSIDCKPGWCLEYVRRTFGQDAVPGYGSATAAWNNSKTQHRDRNFPAGVAIPVYYGLANEPNGHIVLRMPDGSAYSTSDLSDVPHHHPNLADLESYYAYYGMPLSYRGWTEDVQGTPVIAPAITKDELDMATPKEVVDLLLNTKVQKGDGSGEITFAQLLAWYDPNRAKDLEAIFTRKVSRAGGQSGVTNLQSTLAWLDANLKQIVAAEAAQTAQLNALVGAIAAIAKGQPFDQAKLVASIQSATAAGVKDAIASIDTTVTIK